MPETRKGENVAYTDPREGESRAVRSYGNQSVNGSTVTLGLIAAPDIPEKIARELASELPDLLSSRVATGISWDVAVVVDPLTGTDRQAPEILEECQKKMLSEGWDLAICLTDLPVYRGGRLIAADLSSERGVGSLAPVLIPRNFTSRTDPTADTTTACFTPAASAKSTRRCCTLSPGAILMT